MASRPLKVPALLLLLLLIAVAGSPPAAAQTGPAQAGGFYDPPSPLPDGPPGALLRVEPFPSAPAGARGWRVLYRSTGPDGSPLAVSGVVFAPDGPPPPGGRPVVAWAHPTTGIARDCAPSLLAPLLPARIAGLADLLARGYVVAATDYPGLGTPSPHPYLVGESEARAVLDSARAAARIAEAGAGVALAVWGHSQGGHAALFAGQVAPAYAPELTLAGVAAAAPPTDLTALFALNIEQTAGRLLASFAFVSWSEVYAGADFRTLVRPSAVPLMEKIARTCVRTTPGLLLAAVPARALGRTFLVRRPEAEQPWRSLFALNSPGGAPLRAPLLVLQGAADDIVPPAITEAYVAARCRAGEVAALRLYPGIDHAATGQAAAADAVAWIADRFAGGPVPSTCSGR